MRLREWALLVLLSIPWGATFVFVEVALHDLTPLQLALARVATAAVGLHVGLRMVGLRLPGDRLTWGSFAVLGLLNNVLPFSLIFWGQTALTGGLAAILNATAPLWTVLLAHWLTLDERITPAKLAGVLIGLAGTVLVIGPAALSGLGTEVWPELAVIAASCCYALAGIFGRRFRGVPPLVTATGQLTCSALVMLPVVLLFSPPRWGIMPGQATIIAVLCLGLVSTALAYTLYFRILAVAGATNVVLVTFLVPITALLLGALVLGEQVRMRELLGMGLIGVGLAVIDGRLTRRIRLAFGPSR
jgi:drug/metabolite transporter (DMT)-like permease